MINLPKAFRYAGVYCGIKRNTSKLDLSLIVSDQPAAAAGIHAASGQVAAKEDAFVAAARGMLTTDTTHKIASRATSIGGQSIVLAGMAKGAAMIGPNMATMLGVVLTDAALEPESAQELLSSVADETFNCISVE